MEYILLLTACINPDGMPFTCLADVGVRKKQYIEALNFYLKNNWLPKYTNKSLRFQYR